MRSDISSVVFRATMFALAGLTLVLLIAPTLVVLRSSGGGEEEDLDESAFVRLACDDKLGVLAAFHRQFPGVHAELAFGFGFAVAFQAGGLQDRGDVLFEIRILSAGRTGQGSDCKKRKG